MYLYSAPNVIEIYLHCSFEFLETVTHTVLFNFYELSYYGTNHISSHIKEEIPGARLFDVLALRKSVQVTFKLHVIYMPAQRSYGGDW